MTAPIMTAPIMTAPTGREGTNNGKWKMGEQEQQPEA